MFPFSQNHSQILNDNDEEEYAKIFEVNILRWDLYSKLDPDIDWATEFLRKEKIPNSKYHRDAQKKSEQVFLLEPAMLSVA